MDTFSAVPRIQRFPITIVDQEKLPEFYESDDIDAPIPTITKIYVGFEKGPGTPTPVQIEVDSIESEYESNLPTTEDGVSMSANEYVDKWRRVNMLLRRNLLLAVVKGLDIESANVLAAGTSNDDGEGRTILERLGWLATREELAERRAESTTENEQEGEGVTGESTLSISPPSTKESTSRRKK